MSALGLYDMLARRFSWRKWFFSCWVLFHDWEWADARDCKPPQIAVVGVWYCKRCGRENWE